MTDEEAIGAVIDEMYDIDLGAEGPARLVAAEKQLSCRERGKSAPGSTNRDARQMKIMSQEEYARDTTPFFAANDFYEIETARRFDIFGNIAHVWSHYEARTSPSDEDVERRGINSIQLFRDPDHGWRIIHMIWDNERD